MAFEAKKGSSRLMGLASAVSKDGSKIKQQPEGAKYHCDGQVESSGARIVGLEPHESQEKHGKRGEMAGTDAGLG
jgi:hypothetical protein